MGSHRVGQDLKRLSSSSINNLRHADNTTLMAESEEELKSLLIKVKDKFSPAGDRIDNAGYIASYTFNRNLKAELYSATLLERQNSCLFTKQACNSTISNK